MILPPYYVATNGDLERLTKVNINEICKYTEEIGAIYERTYALQTMGDIGAN